jgi:hypothetical protein
MPVLRDAGVGHVRAREVQRAPREHQAAVRRRLVAQVELQRSVGQPAEAVVEEAVDRPRVHEVAVLDVLAHIVEVGSDADLDARVVEDAAEHRRVALGRHVLEDCR